MLFLLDVFGVLDESKNAYKYSENAFDLLYC